MQNNRIRSFPRFSQAASAFFLYAAFAANPAMAQLPVVPGAAGGLPPCDVNVAAPAATAAFPCGVIISPARAGFSSQELSSLAQGAGARVRYEYGMVAAVAATVPNRSVLRAFSPADVRLTPDRRVTIIAQPPGKGGGGSTSSSQVLPAGIKRIGAWTETNGVFQSAVSNPGQGVGVAIVDTGLDFGHADLNPASRPDCFDAFGADCQDQNGHGTHVAGIVAAQNNSIGVVGVAPAATLYAVRVLDASGSGSDSTVMAGLDWVWTQNGGNSSTAPPKISVVNMSLGRGGNATDNLPLHDAVVKLTGGTLSSGATIGGQGVTIIVAAGNDPKLEVAQQVPAAYKEVLAVASTTAVGGVNSCNRLGSAIGADTASYFTTDGKATETRAGVAVSAPGSDQENVSRGCIISTVGILSLKLGGGTVRMSGTSMAAPHVAGVAALVIGQGTSDPNTLKTRIQCSDRNGTAPLDSPTSSYTFDGVREGIVLVSRALASTCP